MCTAPDESQRTKQKPTNLCVMIIKDWSKDELLMLKKIEELRTELSSVRKELEKVQDDYEVDSIRFFGKSPTGWNTLDNEEGQMNGWEG